ncbi:TMEM164 family acyltransferase [Paenibacillus alginolyticus]|uniref:TMEM164 family acyltransferase n=1 Tax=Paenibacillus alginolyticus TaxID=59839 RepID=UPI00406BBCD0
MTALMLPESCLYLWYVFEKMWDIRYTLPLELCSITLVLSIIMLFNRSILLYQILYFAGIGVAILYMTWIENYKPTWKSIGITMIFLNVILVFVGSVDSLLHANYMFLLHKPDTVSILDFLGPYPYYLIFEELIAIVIFIVIFLPFIVGRKKVAILSK